MTRMRRSAVGPRRPDVRAGDNAAAQSQPSLEQRKANYAPWSPDQMPQRRREQGLIGRARRGRCRRRPSVLSQEAGDNRAADAVGAPAARQTAGRTPLGLADPGKTLLIVIGELMGANPDLTVQTAMKRAIEERGVKCISCRLGAARTSPRDYLELRRGVRTSTIATAARARVLLHHHRHDAGPAPGPRTGCARRTLSSTRRPGRSRSSPTSKLAAIARDFEAGLSNALVRGSTSTRGRLDRMARRRPAPDPQGAAPSRREIPRQLHLRRSLRPDEPDAVLSFRRLAPDRDQDDRAAGVSSIASR